MKSLYKSILISFIIIITAIIIYILFVNSRPLANSKENSIDYPLVEITKLISKEHSINITAYGEVISERVLKIKYRDKGRIIRIGNNINNGVYIKKGDLLFEVDPFNIKNDLKEKNLSKRIILLTIQRIIGQMETTHLKQQELIVQRNIIKKQLNKILANENKVFSENSIDNLRLLLSSKEEKLLDNIELINLLSIELETNKAEIEKLDYNMAKLNNDLKETKVVAPFSGHISNLNIEVGQEISLNEVLGELSDSDNLEVKFSIGGIDYYKLMQFSNNGIGETITIKWLIGNKYYKAEAIINRIDGSINRQIAGINLYASIPSSSLSEIPLGAFVEIKLKRQVLSNSILVPLSSVFNNEFIFLLKDGRLKKQKIRIISEEYYGILIEDDELSGKNIVITRLSDMRNNMSINVLAK